MLFSLSILVIEFTLERETKWVSGNLYQMRLWLSALLACLWSLYFLSHNAMLLPPLEVESVCSLGIARFFFASPAVACRFPGSWDWACLMPVCISSYGAVPPTKSVSSEPFVDWPIALGLVLAAQICGSESFPEP